MKQTICPKLDYSEIVLPKEADEFDYVDLILGFEITSSFEGSLRWSNIANNFDLMGMSLGALNQNLGSGTLQPMLLTMLREYPKVLEYSFTRDQYNKIVKMLTDWENSRQTFAEDEFYSPLDRQEFTIFSVAASRNQKSVKWAQQNLYVSKKMKSDWASNFKKLASTPEYKNLQLQEANKIHIKAVRYVATFALSELRSFLLMFDFVTQNGGFSAKAIKEIQAYFVANPRFNEQQKLDAILKVRLKSVKTQYVEDVRKRKRAIIDGHGIVHGKHRYLEKEYCFAGLTLPSGLGLSSQ